ncbi:ParB N-terminal domain-containing protein [Pantoea agglomerans]|uniref:plasmid partitioning protein RepB C-terminal domain-containing protein n=1 Tax=Enterobacter agglomerans TaxID=549 RepID=UPI001786928F|nr:plasmid partitioning protein RepB C-terminal domain-containing protein [Pantoea agglomerans]MBD8240812.1 ParB N-terminal domain-containing protein [Pantoea agglomerans]
MISNCFDNYFYEFNVNELIYSRPLPINVHSSMKFKQIAVTVSEIGLIEPVIVYIDNDGEKRILDGHLRVEVLKGLGIEKVHCLISPVEDSYTYNKRVNRITIVQEQKMLLRAVEAGVSVDKLCTVLGVSIQTVQSKLRLSAGIAPEVLALLSERSVPQALFGLLKKLKPYKQIEVVDTLVSINNFTKKFVESMLHAIPPEHFVNAGHTKEESSDVRRHLERLEKELISVQVETSKLDDEYSENTLKLVIIKGHLERVLNKSDILHWLYDNHPDYLSVFKQIIGIENLNDIVVD